MMAGTIYRISGPVVTVEGLADPKMYDVVKVGDEGLIGEIIKLDRGTAIVQVYEDTNGLKPGERVENTGAQLSVELGPGLIGSIYDGIQRPLDKIKATSGDFIARGVSADPLDKKKKWSFRPVVENGREVKGGDVIGEVDETSLIKHRVLVPPGISGKISGLEAGSYTIKEAIAKVGDEEIRLTQRWPVRVARPVADKMMLDAPLVTGQRVIDTFFPVAKGGTAAVPGPFGSGKCIVGETKILIDGSLMEIKDAFNSMEGSTERLSDNESVKNLNKESKVYTFDGQKTRTTNVHQIYKGVTEKIVEIKTKSGRCIKMTPIHKLHVLDKELNMVEREAYKLNPGEYVASPRKIDADWEYQNVNIDFDCRVADGHAIAEMNAAIDAYIRKKKITLKRFSEILGIDYAVVIGYHNSSNRPPMSFLRKLEKLTGKEIEVGSIEAGRGAKPVKVVKYLDEDLAELLGLLIADGTVRGAGTVIFFNNNVELLGRAGELFRKLFGLEAKETWQRTVNSMTVHSRAVADLLHSFGYPTKRKSRNALLPKGLLDSPKSVLESFLRAYIEGDGALGYREIEITTTSKNMRDGLAYLLLRLGILYRISKMTEAGRTYHKIFISPNEAVKLYPQYGRDLHFNSSDIVPMTTALFKSMPDAAKPSALEKADIETAGYYADQNFAVQVFAKMASESKQEKLTKLAGALEYIFLDEITEVNQIDEKTDVYDLVVPETHNFIGGDAPMLLHNTVIQHQLAKWSDADVIVYVGCGERGNEMVEILSTFPELKDPKTGKPLMDRTILIANTSNMPVAAREASIYTGMTLAEYYRDMGYSVALMADSTSRWAEALREISGRLEEMPGEEGYPAYLGRKVAEFYERAGKVHTLNGSTGSVTAIGAVSPAGGDTSEPVSQNTLRVTRVFWALDAALANSRHFPSVNWLNSYSLYVDDLAKWYADNVGKGWHELYREAMKTLQKEAEINEVVQLVGYDALPEADKLTLDTAKSIREDYLQQSAFDEVDTYTTLHKQHLMLEAIIELAGAGSDALKKGITMEQLSELSVKQKIARMKYAKEDEADAYYKDVARDIAAIGAMKAEAAK